MSRDGDSNPKPAVYKTAALPLSYLGLNLLLPVLLGKILTNFARWCWDETAAPPATLCASNAGRSTIELGRYYGEQAKQLPRIPRLRVLERLNSNYSKITFPLKHYMEISDKMISLGILVDIN